MGSSKRKIFMGTGNVGIPGRGDSVPEVPGAISRKAVTEPVTAVTCGFTIDVECAMDNVTCV